MERLSPCKIMNTKPIMGRPATGNVPKLLRAKPSTWEALEQLRIMTRKPTIGAVLDQWADSVTSKRFSTN